MNFLHAFPDQEKSAKEHHEVFSREAMTEQREQWVDELGEQKNEAQKDDARDECEHEADVPRTGLLLGREFSGEDGDEDDVVHAEDNFEDGEGEETHPRIRIR